MSVLYHIKECNTISFVIVFNLIMFLCSLIYTPCVSALQYLDGLNTRLDKSIYNYFTLFSASSLLCIISQDDKAAVDVLDFCKNVNKPVMLSDLSGLDWKQCNVVVMIEVITFETCPDVGSNGFKPTLYIINYSTGPNLTSLGRCLANSLSPEVVAISLADGSVWELSSVYSPPRHFSSGSVAEVIRHRAGLSTPDFGGRVVTAAVMDYPPFIISREKYNSGDFPVEDAFDGIEYIILKELAQKLNFTPKYDMYVNWGSTLENGTWVGGIGQAMQDNAVDIAFANIWQIPSFYTIMDFGPALNKRKVNFLVRRPQKIAFKKNALLSIFGPEVWIGSYGSLCLLALVYWSVIKLDHRHRAEDMSGSLLTMYGHLMMTSSYSRVSDGSTRYILTSWSIFALLITASFSSGIVSRLTLTLYSPRVDTVQQLVEQDYYWTVHYYVRYRISDTMKNVFFNLEDPWNVLFEQRYEYMEAEEVSEKASSDKKLTFMVQMFGENYPVVSIPGLIGHKDLRLFRLAEQTICEGHVSWGVRKNSPLLKPLSFTTLRLLQMGLQQSWLDEVILRWPIYDTRHLLVEEDISTFNQPQPLDITKILGVFYKLVFGLGICCLVFVVEVIW